MLVRMVVRRRGRMDVPVNNVYLCIDKYYLLHKNRILTHELVIIIRTVGSTRRKCQVRILFIIFM